MAILNYLKKEINAKVVYYGPGLSGKTSNIQFIYQKLKPEYKGKLMTLATQTDRTLFFDFLPLELGEIKGLKTRFQIYTVPGQVYYNATRKLVLKNVDGVVFVVDSQKKMFNENIESFKNLEDNLKFYNRALRDVPLVFQYNKRDMGDVLSIQELQRSLNHFDAPYFEATAHRGDGVLQTLTTVTKIVLQKLRSTNEFQKQGSVKANAELNASEPANLSQPEREPVPAVASSVIENEKAVSTVAMDQPEGNRGVEVGIPEVISRNIFRIPIKINMEDGTIRSFNITINIEE